MKNFMYYYAVFTLAFAGLFILLLLFWAVYPYNVVDILGDYKILTPIVHSGEELKYQRNANKHMNIQAVASCALIDGIEYKFPSRTTSTPVGEDHSIQLLIVPTQIESGTYRYVCQLLYQVNPIRVITVHIQTEKFQVIQPKE